MKHDCLDKYYICNKDSIFGNVGVIHNYDKHRQSPFEISTVISLLMTTVVEGKDKRACRLAQGRQERRMSLNCEYAGKTILQA